MEHQVLKFENNKIYQIKNFNAQPINKDFYYKSIVNKYLDFFKTKNSYNFNIHNFQLDKSQYTEFLYFKFFYCCNLMFSFFGLQHKNSTNVWAYANNKDYFSTAIHNHKNTSIINGVYYFNVPKKEQSILKFYNKHNIEIGEILTETDDLLIFSCDLNHMPLQSFTDDFRIALNMEIMCDREVLTFFKD
jgi:hypothetical protein